MGRRGALGQPPPAWRERRREVIPWCTVHHSPPLETQRLRKLLFYWSFGYRFLRWKAAAAAWERGRPQGVPTATSRLRGCSRSGSSSGFPPAHDVLDRLSLLLCCRKLLGTALDSVAEKAGLWHGSIQELYLLLLLHVSETQPEMALLDHKHGHRTTQRLCGHLRRSEREVRRSTQLM